MTRSWTHRLVAALGLAIGLALTAGPGTTAPVDTVSNDAAAKLMTAEIDYLKKTLDKTPPKNAAGTIKASAMMLALVSDGPLQESALKIAESMAGKSPDFAGAKAIAAKLAPGPVKLGDAAKLAKAAKLDCSEAMSPFRGGTGGMSLEKEIKGTMKKVTDVPAAELLAIRTTALGEYTKVTPNDKATANPTKAKNWEKYNDSMFKATKDAMVEAAKGAKADKDLIRKKMLSIDAQCVACHQEFRD